MKLLGRQSRLTSEQKRQLNSLKWEEIICATLGIIVALVSVGAFIDSLMWLF